MRAFLTLALLAFALPACDVVDEDDVYAATAKRLVALAKEA